MTAPNRIGSLAVAGISHPRTAAHLRERIHLTPNDAAILSRELATGGHEALALSTCARTELYVTGPGAAETLWNARRLFAKALGAGALSRGVYSLSNEGAARHLFRVAAGLESVVVGDTHVAGQVREAHQAAREHGATGPILDRLFEVASAASKKVRAQTTLSAGPTTIPGAAIAAAARLAGPLASRHVVVLGAGTVARATALSAASRGCTQITIANRSLEGAREIALRVGARAIRLADLGAYLADTDVVVAATASRGFVLTAQHLADCRRVAPMLVFDLGVPRNVDPELGRVPGVQVLGLDDLADDLRSTDLERRRDLCRAEQIICDEAARWEQWRLTRAAAPAVAALHQAAERARQDVLKRHARDLSRLPADDVGLIDAITTQLVAKLLHEPTVELRRQALLIGEAA